VENQGQNKTPDLDALRNMLAELSVRGQARHEHFLQQMDHLMAQTRRDLAAAGKHLKNHARAIEESHARMAEIEAIHKDSEATLNRATRKLELHGDLIAELIKTKIDRKKRPPRK